jgi:glucose/arabinose dehydrogenase
MESSIIMGSWKITFEVERFIDAESYEDAVTEVFKDQKGIYRIVDVKQL